VRSGAHPRMPSRHGHGEWRAERPVPSAGAGPPEGVWHRGCERRDGLTHRAKRAGSRLRIGFRTRIALFFAGLIVVVNLAVLAIQRAPIVSAFEGTLRVRGRELVLNLAARASAAAAKSERADLKNLAETFLEFDDVAGAAILMRDGAVFAGTLADGWQTTEPGQPAPGDVLALEDRDGADFVARIPGTDAAARLRLGEGALRRAIGGIGLTIGSVAAAAMGIGFLLVLVAASVFTRPIHLMVDLADRIRDGELGARLDLGRGDDLGRLAAAMDAMSTELRENHDRLTAAKAAAESQNEVLEQQGRRLETQTRNLETLVASIAEGVLFLDQRRHVAVANRAAEALLGVAAQGLIGLPLEDLRFPKADGRLLSMLDDAFARTDRGERHHSEACVADHLYTVTSVHQPGGSPLGVLAVVRDLSQIRALESEQEELLDQLYQQEKMAIVGLLAASLAHELNTPLGTILLHTERLAREHAGSEEGATLETVQHQVHRCREIVRRLLDFSRLAEGRPAALDIEGVIDRSISLAQAGLRQKGISIRKALAPGTPRVWADANQMEQVLINLIWNAADAMPDGGKIDIRVSCDGGFVAVRVHDEGKGIPADILDRVFDPFFTTKPRGQGTGLGLAICQRIMEEHGGTITIESSPEPGTEVLLRIPVAAGDDD